MWSSDGKSTDTRGNEEKLSPNSPGHWEQRSEEVFHLIDTLLSFEACLYHQFAPFAIEDNQLLLSMVHPEDTEALDYVSRIVSYINCKIVAHQISTDTHRSILSAYLNHKNTFLPNGQEVDEEAINLLSEHSKTTIIQEIDQIIESGTTSFPTYERGSMSFSQTENPQHSQPLHNYSPTSNINNLSANTTPSPSIDDKQTAEAARLKLLSKLTVLQIHFSEEFIPIETLVSLPPKKLLEELLRRVMSGGIGRLYLERQPYQGRIFWSDNGVMQSVLENLPLSVFQGVLNQLKNFASLPVTKISEPQQVEKECLYQKNRLLLRLRVIPGTYGEEATLQILKGTALKFYHQQQLVRLTSDTLVISQQLSLKLHELQERMLLNSNLKSEQLSSVMALNKLVENLDQQIQKLRATSDRPKDR
ncbi:pilus assembly protein PilB [Nodularia harveyana UHCC-0300]|uniref:Pilus assembly protein PilB n=1 Tax=Nodularia harveyana UHCC-0300 TaxID=2974287 RepID=A0ABU5UKW2_9CYAN|nr:pilus assembly protein PilB [Nodularia harveyana]MEA5583066.1 pilus assembly protein PilB [Nodularia harveyana UHCC-0300]